MPGIWNRAGKALIIDDAVKPDDAYSEIIRHGVNTRFNKTIRSPLAIETTPIVVIMQRIHYHDLSGYLLWVAVARSGIT